MIDIRRKTRTLGYGSWLTLRRNDTKLYPVVTKNSVTKVEKACIDVSLPAFGGKDVIVTTGRIVALMQDAK